MVTPNPDIRAPDKPSLFFFFLLKLLDKPSDKANALCHNTIAQAAT